jgi:hypothetical protein
MVETGGRKLMNELEITWLRVLQFWWAYTWRGILYVMLPTLIVGAGMGIGFALNHVPIKEHAWAIRGIGTLISLPLSLWVTKTVLTTQFAKFRIALISSGAEARTQSVGSPYPTIRPNEPTSGGSSM